MNGAVDRRAEIDALFVQALDLDDVDRPAFLDRIDDAFLRAEVASLLRWAQSPDDPFRLNADAAARLIDEAFDRVKSDLGDVDDDALPPEIGAWRILRELGAGGMGRVLLVERTAGGFDQRGALKLIRHGIGASEFSRRFMQERQILATLNHPGIARLLDGGRDAGGRLYLVMEYVDGQQIDSYCDDRRLTIEQRVVLFAQVCDAVAFAHRNLIVHRDLKPSNIVVAADGSVKLLDFGIAKVLAPSAPDAAPMTRADLRLFTPEYASPEQVRGQAVATASDVYQLGLLLYELLCGHRAQTVADATPAGIERAICVTEPPRPSQRVADDDEHRATARQLRIAGLRRMLRGDLDNIVLKATRKEPERRYASVAELVEDIERWRAGRTVRARPDTLGYRSATFLRRHPVGVAFAASMLLLLIGYAVTVTLQAQAIAHERDRAQAEATKARQVQGLVQRLFEGIDPDVSGGAPLSVKALLDRSWGQIEGELATQPEVRAELLDTVGNVYRALGEFERATELLTSARDLADALMDTQPLLAAKILRSLGQVLGEGNRVDESEQLLQRSLAIYRRQLGEKHAEVAATLMMLGRVQQRRGRHTEAGANIELARGTYQALYGNQHASVADSLSRLADVERAMGRFEHAQALLEEALQIRRAVLPAGHPLLATNLADLAAVKGERGDLAGADALYPGAIDELKRSRGDRHPDVAVELSNYGKILRQLNRFDESEAMQREALAILREVYGERHAKVALVLNDLGALFYRQGRREEARSSFQQALAALPESHAWFRPVYLRRLGIVDTAMGEVRDAQAHFAQARQLLLQEEDRRTDLLAVVTRLVGTARHQLGDIKGAESDLRDALTYFDSLPESDPMEYGSALALLGEILVDTGRYTEAVPLLDRGLQMFKRTNEGSERAVSTSALLERAKARAASR